MLDIWHRRLGHINEKYVRIICPFIPKFLTLSFCPYCVIAKMKKKGFNKDKKNVKDIVKNFRKSDEKYVKQRELRKRNKISKEQMKVNIESYGRIEPGEIIACDLKHMPKSENGHEYLCTFTCIGTRLSESVYFKTRLAKEFTEAYIKYCKHIRNKTGRYPKYLITDNGKEFIDKCTAEYNKEKGISHNFTAPHSSLQNSIAERINRTIGEGCLALLLCAHLPLSFWIYAVGFFNFVKSRTPHKSLNFSNPISCWNVFNTHRAGIDLYDIRIFGSEAYVLDEKSLKAYPKAFRCIYLGPSNTQKGYLFYNLYTRKVICSRNFIINEQCIPGKSYFPKIYDNYLGPSPPFELSDIQQITERPTTVFDSLKIPYSNLFNFDGANDNDNNNDDSNHSDTTVNFNECKVDDDNKNDEDTKINDDDDMKDESCIIDEFVIDVNPESLYVFDRNVLSKVGEGDMPPLEPPTPVANKPRPDTSTDTKTDPTDKPEPDKTDWYSNDACPTEEQFEWVAITGKRQTKFGKTMGGRWKYGGNEFDYQVQWANGESTYEPETLVREYAADAIEDYELKHQPGTTGNFQPELDVPENDQTNTEDTEQVSSSVSFTNFCNFVHVHFFCYLSKLSPFANNGSWRNIKTPKNRYEMLRSPEREQWLAAERRELDSLIAKGTWKKVKRPKKKPITCTWVYKLKPPTTLSPNPIFKARLCAHGYKQKEGEDYSSTFAQVATLKAFRILLWLSVFLGYKCTQMDVKNAFLAGTLDKEIYMLPPNGYEDEVGCVILIKSIYGLKQAPRIWYQTLVSALHSFGFKELISDSCVFQHCQQKCYLLIFVDDIICITNDEVFRSKVEKLLQSTFDIKLLGPLRHFVGIQVDINKNGDIHLHQSDYIQRLRDIFNSYFTNQSSKINAPCDSSVKFSKHQQPTKPHTQKKMSAFPYRKLIGCLLYLLGTRPEIYFIIISLSRFVANPGLVHWLAALRVLFYVCNTPLFGILIRKGQELKLQVYVDSDHASNVDDRKSISGYIIYLGTTPIVWRSRKQKGKPAISSCEAEYIALSAAINEIVWIITFLKELGFDVPLPVPLYGDNSSADDLAHNPVHHDRTKHIDIRYHRIREFILDGTIQMFHVSSQDNPADIFTKSVTVSVFKRLIRFVYGKFTT